jgi:hypothetical protein
MTSSSLSRCSQDLAYFVNNETPDKIFIDLKLSKNTRFDFVPSENKCLDSS